MMKRQLSTLLQAEEEAETQIRGLDTKRKQRVESLSADPELAGQMAEADKTGSQLGEEKARAQANIAAHDAELQGLEKEVISKSESAEGRVSDRDLIRVGQRTAECDHGAGTATGQHFALGDRGAEDGPRRPCAEAGEGREGDQHTRVEAGGRTAVLQVCGRGRNAGPTS